MKVQIICGVFAKENQPEVMAQSKGGVEFSANMLQQKLIDGFSAAGYAPQVLSAPFLGAWPMGSRTFRFRSFRQPQHTCRYVPFCNVWGLRNPSRARALKQAVRDFAADPDPEKLILVYCPHTPFLEAAVYAKKLDPRIRICLYVPDLPNYMNLSEKRSRLYDFLKKYDVAAMTALMEQVDSFVLLTAQMASALPVRNKPVLVLEGLISDASGEAPAPAPADPEKRIIYAGKLNRKFGIPQLIGGFSLLRDPACRLILCGRGDCDGYAREAARRDPRIRCMGQLSPEDAARLQRSAAVLVNPRPNNEEYTKYSFPSKTIDYLLTGRPVAACLLDGMPGAYRDFLYVIEGSAPADIAAALEAALQNREGEEKYRRFLAYAGEKLTASRAAEAIAAMNRKSEER